MRSTVASSFRRSVLALLGFASLSLLAAACGATDASVVEGGLYSVSVGRDGYQVAKVLLCDEQAVHVRLYTQHYAARPTAVGTDELTLAAGDGSPAFGLAHLPLTRTAFLECQPVLIRTASVSKDELEGVALWLRGGGTLLGKP